MYNLTTTLYNVGIVSQLYNNLQVNMRVMLTHLVSYGIKLVLHANITRFKIYHS